MADYDRMRDDEWYEAPRYHTVPNSGDIANIRRTLDLGDVDIETYLSTNNDVEDLNTYLMNKHNFIVEYDEFPLIVPKKQVRCKGQPNQMRLEANKANIRLNLIFEEGIEFKDILKVHLKVRRANTVPLYIKQLYTGYVKLHPVEMFRQEGSATNRVTVYANLDNLVEDDYSHYIYNLSKTNPKHNEFNVLIEVVLHDNSVSNFTTKTFSVVGQRFAEKRKGPNSPDSSSSSKTRIYENFIDPSENKNFAQHQRIVYELVEAKQGIFDNLKANVIKTGNGDIAYHFVLKDQESKGANYIPGEIIGFTTDHHSKGVVVIDKLSPSNAEKAFLKGVVTESQYIEAKLPQDRTVITATICMLGVVPVRVLGPVNPGEGLFASNALPGTAISKKFLESPKSDALIGYAFEGVECHTDEVNEIQALVSIISGAGHLLVERQLTVLEKSLKSSMTFNMKRSRKCYTLVTLIVVLLLILLGFIVYQLKASGTWYKKWMCQYGSVGSCRYWYWLQGGEYLGYQFEDCNKAWEKAFTKRKFYKRPHSENESKPKCINETKEGKVVRYNYYINQDSCSGIPMPGSRYLFAADKQCETLWMFDEVDGEWKKDERVCFNPRCNIMCNDTKRECPYYGWKKCRH